MEQSHLVELLATLTSQEKEQLLPFASARLFNRDKLKKHILTLLNICISHDWTDPNHKLEKQDLFARVFDGQAFFEGKLEKVMVEAHKVVRAFLTTEYYLRDENEFRQMLDFAEIVRLRGLNARHEQYMTKLIKNQKEYPWKGTAYFHNQFQLETAVHYMACLNNLQKGDLNIPNVLHATETYFYLRKIALLSRYLLQQVVTKLDVPEIIQFHLENVQVPGWCLDASPQLKINYTIFQVLKKGTPTHEDIQDLKKKLLVYETEVDQEALQEFYSYLRNFCSLLLMDSHDKEQIRTMLHAIYKDNLHRGYLHYEGKITPSRFATIVDNALNIKDFDWTLAFIEQNKHLIYGDNETSDIYRLNKARYLFAIQQYSNCLDHIPPTALDVENMLAGKRLELKALYEIKSDLFSYKLDAFKMHLSRTSPKILSDFKRRIYVDFVNLLTRLQACPPGDHKRAERIYDNIKANKQVAEWRWLLEKAEALKSK